MSVIVKDMNMPTSCTMCWLSIFCEIWVNEPMRHKGYDNRLDGCPLVELTAEPERKHGRWIQISPAKIYACSECNQNVMTDDIVCYNFCHHCGARMEG